MTGKRKTKLTFLLLMLSISHLAAGEETSIFDLSLEELMKVKITGSTRTPETLITVPSAVTVFTQKEINRIGLDTLDELMNLVPGFQSYRTSFSALHYPFSSRGRRIGLPSSEILILVDGQRLNEPRTGGIAVVVPNFPLSIIESVEFIRGPGSAVYGSNAMMGIINIVTRSKSNEISISTGSLNRKKGYFLSSQQFGDATIDLYGNLDIDDGDSYQLQDTFSPSIISTKDPRKIADFNVKIKWQNTRLNFQHNQFTANDFYEVNQISNGFNERKARLSSISLTQDFAWHSISSSVQLSFSEANFSTARQVTAKGALSAISTPSSEEPLFLRVNFNEFSEARALVHNEWNIDENTDFQFGLEFRRIKSPSAIASNNFDLGDLSNRNFPVQYYGELLPTTEIQRSSSRNITGLYGQYQRKLFESSHLTLGLRYDNFSDIGSELSSRFGLIKEINSNHSIKLLYNEAFRAPSENELNLLSTSLVLGDQNLKPETVETWELIWLGLWLNTRVSVGYFVNHFENSIVQVANDRLRYENVSQGPTKGFEVEISRELSKNWLVRATYTRFNENSAMSFREANKLASAMINYQQEQLNVNLSAYYHDTRNAMSQVNSTEDFALEDYWLLSTKASFRFEANWEAFVQIKNLLNKAYSTPPADNLLTDGAPNRGRNFLLGIVSRF